MKMGQPLDNYVQVSEGVYIRLELCQFINIEESAIHESVVNESAVQEKSIITRIEEWDKEATKKAHNIIRNHESTIVFIIMVILGIVIFCK